jgi:hypothetical protein
MKALGMVLNDWQLSGVWTAQTGTAYAAGFSYQNGGGNVNLTGSPDYAARIVLVGDPGAGDDHESALRPERRRGPGPLPAAWCRLRSGD